MSLPYRQERLLRRADRALCQSDPDLASMLSIFARITASERLPAWEQLRPKAAWARRVLLWPVAAAAFSSSSSPAGALKPRWRAVPGSSPSYPGLAHGG
jgi:hypothetical protein